MAACSMTSPLCLDPSACSSSSTAKSLTPDPEDPSSLSATSSSSVRSTAITAPLFGNSIGTNLPWYCENSAYHTHFSDSFTTSYPNPPLILDLNTSLNWSIMPYAITNNG